jgi:multiple sugar transport system permease protein
MGRRTEAAMLKSRKNEILAAIVLAGPFVALYAWMFIYPTIQMVHLSFMNAPLIGEGTWTGLKNYTRLLSDRTFKNAVWNTAYFVLLTVIPGTAVSLIIALMVSRLNGWLQSVILAMFFVPYVLPVTVVYILWDWLVNVQFGVLQPLIELFTGKPVNVWRTIPWFMPGVAIVTIWWTNGFSILLFLAGLRNIPKEIYEAAELDGASRWQVFRRLTWPLLWPVTALCLTIQLILQLKIFDQVYLFSLSGRTQATMVMVQYIFEQGFQRNKGGYAATIAVALFVIVVAFSLLQLQAARFRRSM